MPRIVHYVATAAAASAIALPAAAQAAPRVVNGCAIRTKTSCPGARLAGANLRGVNMSTANLKGANLRGADLRKATFSGASMQGVDFTGANIQDANLTNARLINTKVPSGSSSLVSGAVWSNTTCPTGNVATGTACNLATP